MGNDSSEISINDITIEDLNMSEYNLCGTVFLRTQFISCVFYTTDLTHSDFSGSKFCNCPFSRNWIYKSTWDDVEFIQCSIISLEAAKTDFYDIVMQNCEVKDSRFIRCGFTHVELEQVDAFTFTVFSNCIFDQCDFKNCQFNRVEFIGCTFINTSIDTLNTSVQYNDCVFYDT